MSVATDRIDIHDPITELCDRLGLEASAVSCIVFRPDTVTATVYLRDENGGVRLNSAKTGAVSETRSFDVTT